MKPFFSLNSELCPKGQKTLFPFTEWNGWGHNGKTGWEYNFYIPRDSRIIDLRRVKLEIQDRITHLISADVEE